MSEILQAALMGEQHVLTGPAERRRVMDLLQDMEPVLRSRGVRRLRLFGSMARGEAELDSNVDLIAEIDGAGAPHFSLIDLIALEQDLAERLGRPVQMTTAPDKMRSHVRETVEREAAEIF